MDCVGAGIGGGAYGQGTITISGNETVVVAKGGEYNGNKADDIGSGINGNIATVTLYDDLISEPYTGGEIINGTIVHRKGSSPDTLDSDKPNAPDQSDILTEKLQVSTRPSKGTAKMTYTDELILQVGARSKDAVNFTFSYSAGGIGGLNADLNCTAKGLGLDKLTLATQEKANFAIDRLDYALNKASLIRATFGAAQNRLEHKITNLTTSAENLTETESAIRDTDMASEMINYTKLNILQQAAQSMLAQANQMPQSVLQMLG